jgi:hypothetical protein
MKKESLKRQELIFDRSRSIKEAVSEAKRRSKNREDLMKKKSKEQQELFFKRNDWKNKTVFEANRRSTIRRKLSEEENQKREESERRKREESRRKKESEKRRKLSEEERQINDAISQFEKLKINPPVYKRRRSGSSGKMDIEEIDDSSPYPREPSRKRSRRT